MAHSRDVTVLLNENIATLWFYYNEKYGTPKLPYMFIFFLFVVLKRHVVLLKIEVVVYNKQVVMYIKKVVMVKMQVVMYSLGLSC